MAEIYKLTTRKRPSIERVPFNIKMPIHVACYYSVADGDEAVAKNIRCGSEFGGLVSAFKKLVTGQFRKILIHDEDGIVKYRMFRKRNHIETIGIFFEWEDWLAKVERERKAKERMKKQMEGF